MKFLPQKAKRQGDVAVSDLSDEFSIHSNASGPGGRTKNRLKKYLPGSSPNKVGQGGLLRRTASDNALLRCNTNTTADDSGNIETSSEVGSVTGRVRQFEGGKVRRMIRNRGLRNSGKSAPPKVSKGMERANSWRSDASSSLGTITRCAVALQKSFVHRAWGCGTKQRLQNE